MTRAAGVHFRQLLQHIEAVHALHHQIQQDEIRLLEEIPLERDQAVFRFGDFVARRLQHLARATPRHARIVDEQDLGPPHTRAISASAMPSSGTAPSLSPASTIDRGMP